MAKNKSIYKNTLMFLKTGGQMEQHKCVFEKIKVDMILIKGKFIEVIIWKCKQCDKVQIFDNDNGKVLQLSPKYLQTLSL